MVEPPTPVDEEGRIGALRRLKLLDTPAEEELDRITKSVARVMRVPIALISIVDENRQWFKSKVGLDVTETPRSISFCGHAVAKRGPLVVEDALEDERFKDNPLVVNDPKVRFYAGVPLRTTDDHIIGTLCVIDRQARELEGDELEMLKALAECVESHLHMRERVLTLEDVADNTTRAMAMAIHDLKNPLTGLLAGSQLLRAGHGDDELADDLVEASRQMQGIIMNVLDVLVAPGGPDIQRGLINVGEAVAGAVRATRRTAEIRGRRVVSTVDDDLPAIRADREAVTRCLTNMLQNAIRHTAPATDVRIFASKDDGSIEFRIDDAGPGVTESERKEIFLPHHRGAAAGRKGYGLGLAYCASAAQKHGGTVHVESSDRGGALFVLRLPIADRPTST